MADDLFKQIIDVGRHNIPMVDYHVHLKAGLTLEQALAKSRRDGIQYGIAVNCGKGFPTETDDGVRAYFESMKGAALSSSPCRPRDASGRRCSRRSAAAPVRLRLHRFHDLDR